MSDLYNILHQAVSRSNPEAEATLNDLITQNPGGTAKELANVLLTHGNDDGVSQMASLVLKNTLNAKTAQTQIQKYNTWKSIPLETTKHVKGTLLTAMRSAHANLPAFVAQAAAEIACFELPHQQWPEFIPTIKENITSPEAAPHIQQASLKCLGYTCNRLADVRIMLDGQIPELPEATINDMLTALVDGVQPSRPEDTRYVALESLQISLQFADKNMEREAERTYIVKSTILEAASSPSERLRMLAFQTLDHIVDLYYHHLGDYMSDIFTKSKNAIRSDEVDVKMAALELWSQISYVEQQCTVDGVSHQGYTKAAVPDFVPLLLELLPNHEDEDDADDTNSLYSRTGSCLIALCQAVEGESTLPHFAPFIEKNIRQEDWRYRDAAVVAFSAVLESPQSLTVAQYVPTVLEALLQLFNDANETVRQSAVSCIATTCQHYAQSIPENQVNVIMSSALAKLSEPARVATYACTVIYYVASQLRPSSKNQSNLLSPGLYNTLSALMSVFEREDRTEHGFLENAVEAASEVINASAADGHAVLCQLLPVIIERMEGALTMPVVSTEEIDARADLVAHFCLMYQALVRRLDKAQVQVHSQRILESLFKVKTVKGFTRQEDVQYAIGLLADCLEEDFHLYLNHCVPYVLDGIRQFDDAQQCKAAVGALVDICNAVTSRISPFSDHIMTVLTECLRSSVVSRYVKPPVICCIGDVALAISGAFEPYMEITSMLLMQASSQQADHHDSEMVMFVNELRVSVFEAYTGLLVGLDDGSKLNLFVPNVQSVFGLIDMISSPEAFRDAALLKGAVALIGDLARLLGSNDTVKQEMQRCHAAIMQLIHHCASCGDDAREAATYAHQQLAALA